jgi:hypothetical protein
MYKDLPLILSLFFLHFVLISSIFLHELFMYWFLSLFTSDFLIPSACSWGWYLVVNMTIVLYVLLS